MLTIPVYQPSLGGNEKKYTLDCIESSWISSKGKYISEFESKFAEYTQVQHATTVSNGTVALHLALVALGIQPGDEVIVPTFTYIATVNAIKYVGATPVFVDSCLDTWQIDCGDVQRKITSRTRAMLIVHLYGHPCDMDSVMRIAREHKLFVIEDCAEAFGSKFAGHHVGGFGDVSTYSFYGNKTITTGEGGMVVTNNPLLFEKILHYKGQGLAKDREYWHDIIGYNYRMTNICAAIGLAQLEQADEFLQKKRNLAEWYKKELSGLPVTVHNEKMDITHSYWMVSILVDNAASRDDLRNHLKVMGVETRPLFYPIHLMPMYEQYALDRYPHAELLASRGINLPSWPGLTQEQVVYIVEQIKNFFSYQTSYETRSTSA